MHKIGKTAFSSSIHFSNMHRIHRFEFTFQLFEQSMPTVLCRPPVNYYFSFLLFGFFHFCLNFLFHFAGWLFLRNICVSLLPHKFSLFVSFLSFSIPWFNFSKWNVQSKKKEKEKNVIYKRFFLQHFFHFCCCCCCCVLLHFIRDHD